MSGVEATCNAEDVRLEGEAVKAAAAEQREKRRASFMVETAVVKGVVVRERAFCFALVGQQRFVRR